MFSVRELLKPAELQVEGHIKAGDSLLQIQIFSTELHKMQQQRYGVISEQKKST